VAAKSFCENFWLALCFASTIYYIPSSKSNNFFFELTGLWVVTLPPAWAGYVGALLAVRPACPLRGGFTRGGAHLAAARAGGLVVSLSVVIRLAFAVARFAATQSEPLHISVLPVPYPSEASGTGNLAKILLKNSFLFISAAAENL